MFCAGRLLHIHRDCGATSTRHRGTKAVRYRRVSEKSTEQSENVWTSTIDMHSSAHVNLLLLDFWHLLVKPIHTDSHQTRWFNSVFGGFIPLRVSKSGDAPATSGAPCLNICEKSTL